MFDIVGKLIFCIISFKAATSKSNAKNNLIKGMIEDIGCPFENPNQLLMENVCKIAEYYNSEPPENTEDGNTSVYFEFHSEPQVIEMDETKNKITILIHQYMEWEDPDIGLMFNPRLRIVHNSTTFYAYKDWEVSVFCQFEFSLFTFDIQDCQFRQFSDLDSVRFLVLPLSQDQDGWKT